jgi:hypothetical protein
MDCNTARLLLPYFNVRAEPLPAELAEAFEAHAGQCASCTSILQDSGREDRLIAIAMKDVEVPAGLQARLLAGLRKERIRRRRTWPVRHPRWSVAAAVLLLCVGGSLGYWWQRPLPLVDISAFADYSSQAGSREQVDNLLVGRREPRPAVFDYNFLISSTLEMFQGKVVPRLLFEGNGGQIAEVYILTAHDFDLERSFPQSPAGSANYNIELLSDPNNPKIAYLVRYTGGALKWLLVGTTPAG